MLLQEKRVVLANSITLSKKTLSLEVGKSASLVATVLPENAGDKTVTFSTANKAIATVDASGKVTGVKAGTVKITATTNDGNKTDTCAVTVTAS